MHWLAHEVGLVEAIDRHVHMLKIHRPYHESDHVLNLAYNALCDGIRLEDIELRRNDEMFLNALGVERIPDPTTTGDFCRRFSEGQVRTLMAAADKAVASLDAAAEGLFRPRDDRSRRHADGDHGECKQGMDISYKRTPGLSSAAGFAGQDGGGAATGRPLGKPP